MIPQKMKRILPAITFFSISIICLLISGCDSEEQAVKSSLERKVDSILINMSLEEKIGQTCQRGTSSRVKGELSEELKDAVRKGKIGSMINVMNKDYVEELQRIAVEESPNGIPLIFGRDVIHGFKTIFPIPLGTAASWNPDIAEEGSRVAAIEASTNGIRWTFAPMIDISRDARWGRIAESAGEDPYLTSEMARAYVRGFQGEDLANPSSIAACAKHFAAYGAAEGGRDYNTAIIYEQLLRDVYLQPFHASVEEGVATFMTSFNDLNGVPASGNSFLLKQVLRDEWKFDGFVVSDWNSVTEMIPHGFCADEKDAALKASSAGLDMEMMSTSYENYLKELIEEDKLTIAQLDKMVKNILRIKFKLGLFDNPGFDRNRDDMVLSDEHKEAAKKAAVESFVLLKNEGNILPLTNDLKKVAVVGPMADAPHDQLGTWTFDGEQETTETPLPALKNHLGQSKVLFSQGLNYSRDKSKIGFNDALRTARQSEVVLFFAGEEAILSGEAHSRSNIDLPGAQEELISEISKTGKKVILVIMAGRPITIGNIIDKVDAILMAWHPGTMGGPAIVDVLFGEQSPSGRLPVTWPKEVGQIPIYYNHTNTGRPASNESFVQMDSIPIGAWQSSLGNNSHYLDIGFTPQFPFGFGLAYTTFEYNNLKLSSPEIALGDSLIVSAEITNTGSMAGTEVVQLYVRDMVGSLTRPIRELKGFRKISLQPGESKTVEFTIHTDDLRFHNQNMEFVTEPGAFKVWIAPNAHEGLEADFHVISK